LPNLDGKTKFVDLGTHILRKTTTHKAGGNYKFSLHGVTDEKVDDDLDNYMFSLVDPFSKKYY
jgi:hypothetical protein